MSSIAKNIQRIQWIKTPKLSAREKSTRGIAKAPLDGRSRMLNIPRNRAALEKRQRAVEDAL